MAMLLPFFLPLFSSSPSPAAAPAAMSTQYEIYEPGKGFSATQKRRRRRRRVSTVDLGQMYHFALMSTISFKLTSFSTKASRIVYLVL